jgi:hypothetical protein
VEIFVFTYIQDPDPHSISKLDPDPHSPKKLNPVPHKIDADPTHWVRQSSLVKFKFKVGAIP